MFAVVGDVVGGAGSFLSACQKTCVVYPLLRPNFSIFPSSYIGSGLVSRRYVQCRHGLLCRPDFSSPGDIPTFCWLIPGGTDVDEYERWIVQLSERLGEHVVPQLRGRLG